MRELTDVRYVPQMKKNLISVGALELKGLKGTLGEGVFNMFRGSLVVLKGIRCNNMYYLKGNTVTRLASSECLNDDSTRLWRRRLKKVGLKSDEALKGASTCHLKSRESCILDKKKVRFGIVTHHLHDFFDCVHVDV